MINLCRFSHSFSVMCYSSDRKRIQGLTLSCGIQAKSEKMCTGDQEAVYVSSVFHMGQEFFKRCGKHLRSGEVERRNAQGERQVVAGAHQRKGGGCEGDTERAHVLRKSWPHSSEPHLLGLLFLLRPAFSPPPSVAQTLLELLT